MTITINSHVIGEVNNYCSTYLSVPLFFIKLGKGGNEDRKVFTLAAKNCVFQKIVFFVKIFHCKKTTAKPDGIYCWNKKLKLLKANN